MMNFFDLAPAGRTAVTTLCFVALCLCVFIGFTAYRKRFVLPKILMPIGSIVSGIAVVFYSAILRVSRMNKPASALADAFGKWPVIIPILFSLGIFVYGFFVLYREAQYRKNILTRTAIKEGIEKISSGLCFYEESGRVVLMNHRIDTLCHEIVGRDLQNAALFWEILSGGEILETVERLSDGENPSFRLADGSVWAFSREDLGGIIQLAAGDITGLQAINDELKEKNTALAALNKRLREYGENVDELTRSKERLEIKVHIHRELGQTLLASRQYLLDDDGTHSAPIDGWQRNIAMLRKEAEMPQDENPMAMLTRTVKTMGMNLSIEGEMPEEEWLQNLFVQAASEALINAINHANATTLFIRFSGDADTYTAQLRNDGTKPEAEIVEGGGLGSLRRKIEGAGGEMTVTHIPEFILTVTLPKERGDI